MAKFRSQNADTSAPKSNQPQDQLKVGKVEYFEKFSGAGRIVQSDITRIPFHSWRTTYPVQEGDLVNYRLELGPLGWQAVDITKMP